ncbi:MAG: hypothetical protein D6820_16260, partial [Lentisphaerae bacterium]
MRKLINLSLLSQACLTGGIAGAQQNRPERPNVIFILTDDQSWDTIGFMGGKVHTPRLDAMKKQGIFFSNFNVTTTVCSPSRYSFLTGRFAGRCHAPRFMKLHPPGTMTRVENNVELESDAWNLPKVLQKAGYFTGFTGKCHLIHHDWLGGGQNWKKNGLETYPPGADPRDPEIQQKMQKNHRRWCEALKEYGFDWVDGVYPANLKELWCDALNVHNWDWTVHKAMKFLEKARNRPFFLYIATTLHHGPNPANNKNSVLADPHLTGEGYVAETYHDLPPRKEIIRQTTRAGLPENRAFATWLDAGVGAIIDKVKALGLAHNTLIIFTSDHGSYRHGKTTLYD